MTEIEATQAEPTPAETRPTLIELARLDHADRNQGSAPSVEGGSVRTRYRCPRCESLIRVEYDGGFSERYNHGGLEYWRWSIERTPTGAVILDRSHSETRSYGGRATGACGLQIRQLNGSPRSALEQLYDSAFGRSAPHVRIERFDLDALRAAPWTDLALGDPGAPPLRLIADDHALRFAVKHGRMPETLEEYESIGPWADADAIRTIADAFLAQVGATVVEIP
jgi:hypothetical protein